MDPVNSAELGPGKCLRASKSAPEADEAKRKMPGAVPANRHKPIPGDFGSVPVCFNHDPKPLNCEIAQPKKIGLEKQNLLMG